MKIKNIIKIIALILIEITIMNIFAINTSYGKEFSIDKAKLYSKGKCKSLLINTPTGGTIYVDKVFYKNGNTEYPAYCLDVDLKGVDEDNEYSVKVSKVVNNELVRRVIINGYPYKSLSSLGVKNVDEAFTATKMAVYCVLYNYDKDNYTKFKAIGEAGKRTLKAIKKIVSSARNSKETYNDPSVYIEEINSKWSIDKNEKSYISKRFIVKSSIDINEFSIDIKNSKLKGVKIKDENGKETNSFKNKKEFNILIPIEELIQKGEFNLNINAKINSKPILYGEAPNSTSQNYALTGISYEVKTNDLKVEYPENTTTVTVEKVDYDTNKILNGAIFNIYDENKKLVYKDIKSDENGIITLKKMLPGKYYIKEVRAPEGYKLDEKMKPFTVGYNESIIVTITNSKIKITTEKVTKKRLPKTGF